MAETDSRTAALTGGFADAPRDAAFAFRAAMGAMARPGKLHRLTGAAAPAPVSVAAGSLILTLCDPETPLFLAGALDTPALRAWIAFHTGAPLVGPADCAFALGRWADLLPLSSYPLGSPEYPDRSATLIVELDGFDGPASTLRGPGIAGTAALALPDADLLARRPGAFPMGLDLFFTAADQVAGLPRTTRIS